ncbi:MAG: SDR family oxidoreductase [Cyclobacteriaceae bacterium]|jgi:3-oxoacyl-[acyl-carrier protein] reductase
MDLNLKGKNVVITGGSKGIGRSIALAFAEEGANVATCARTEDPLKEVAEKIKSKGVIAYTEKCDISDHKALEKFLESAKDELGSIDVLVNNASALALGDDKGSWQECINVDLLATVKASDKVIPWMIESGEGNIIHISSISGLEATQSRDFAYASIKSAIISHANKIAVNYGAQGIRANSVAPGAVYFENGVWDYVKKNNNEMYEGVKGLTPRGELGTPEEIANVVVFLASDKASFITGTCIVVDGGLHKAN